MLYILKGSHYLHFNRWYHNRDICDVLSLPLLHNGNAKMTNSQNFVHKQTHAIHHYTYFIHLSEQISDIINDKLDAHEGL